MKCVITVIPALKTTAIPGITCEDREQHVIPASHDLTNVIYRGVAGKEKGGQGRAPSPYPFLT